jgi:hypothetical protein
MKRECKLIIFLELIRSMDVRDKEDEEIAS